MCYKTYLLQLHLLLLLSVMFISAGGLLAPETNFLYMIIHSVIGGKSFHLTFQPRLYHEITLLFTFGKLVTGPGL